MSRWLKSVNNLLETLDVQVEDVVEDPHGAVDNVLGFQEEFESDDYDSDDDESEYESEELESEFEEEEVVWGAPDAEEPLFQPDAQPFEEMVTEEEPPPVKPPAVAEQRETHSAPPPPPVPIPLPVPQGVDDSYEEAAPTDIDTNVANEPPPKPAVTKNQSDIASETEVPIRKSSKPPPPPPPMAAGTARKDSKPAKPLKPQPPPPPSPAEPTTAHDSAKETIEPKKEETISTNTPQVSTVPIVASAKMSKQAPMSGLSSVESPPASGYASAPNMTSQGNASDLQQQLKRSNRELKKVQAEVRQLRKHVMQLNVQLETAEGEMAAQRQELQRAAERMEKDRARNNEEREDLLDDHEEELEHMKEHYEKLLVEQRNHYEAKLKDLQDRLAVEEEKRLKEGGDWTQELEESVEREREALKRLSEMKEENAALKSRTTKLEAQQNALQKKLESSAQNLQAACQREREADDKLDAALSLHSRQLSQRQAREAELERIIADLGAALTVARQKEQNRSSQYTSVRTEGDVGYRKQYELAVDELETVKVQLSLETQRCEALRQELNDITQERTEETFAAQARQQQHDREIADLTANVARLEANLREKKKTPSAPGETTGEFSSTDDVRHLKEVEELKGKIASLSEQLIKLQEKNDRSKSEIFALKNRLQASNARAESAEQALASTPPATTSQMYQAEAGGTYGSTMRRRIKGGRSSRNPTSVRSIRSALNMHPGRVSEGTEQIAVTIDAIDSFVVETGSFMRHEPLARLAFLLYLIVLHLWAFCLVLFHAHSFEKEHGDFGSLSESGGLPGEVGHP